MLPSVLIKMRAGEKAQSQNTPGLQVRRGLCLFSVLSCKWDFLVVNGPRWK